MTKTSRLEIVTAARDLMRDKGYAGMSMRDLADQVGLLKGSLYSHFPSKESLVPAVLHLTFNEIFSVLPPSGQWRADYETALNRLIGLLKADSRCVGFHLAYGLDDPALRDAVEAFFRDSRAFLSDILRQGMDIKLAELLARDTLIAVEGATLWLVLYADSAPIEEARTSLLARADSLAEEEPDRQIRKILDQMLGDWRKAGITEKRLAARLVAAEDELLTVRAALAGQIEAESCFR